MGKWLGKIIGGAIGLSLGGPLGMIVGIAFGNLFDSASQITTTTNSFDSVQQEGEAIFFIATFSMLARMAMADGRLLKEEIETVNNFIDHDLKLDPQSKVVAQKIFNTSLSQKIGFEEFANQFYQKFANEKEMLLLMVDILVRVASSDKTISEKERYFINYAATLFRISDNELNRIITKYLGSTLDLDKAYLALSLDKSSSIDEIKKSYRKLSRDFHPDMIASKGLPEEFTLFATEKFQEIQAAYELIKKERNF
jgi:DnaJ like chaperone protein